MKAAAATRNRDFVLASLPASLLLALAVVCTAHASLPLPGSAPGSQTGDAAGPFAGLATSPDANLYSGTASTSVAIETPPGRLGMTPKLSLQYSSAAGSGPYGYGWDLPIARIQRSTKHGTPRYDGSDEFVIQMAGGSQELSRSHAGSAIYRIKTDAGQLRIGFDHRANYWKAIDKSGTVFIFGTHKESRIGFAAGAESTFAWLLERMEDAAGNSIDYSYVYDEEAATSSGLPSRIAYGGNARQAMPHFAFVDFFWKRKQEPSRIRVSYRSGIRRPQDRLLLAIETSIKGRRARRYDASHRRDPVSGVETLAAITLSAFAGDPAGDVVLPSTVFIYSQATRTGWPTGPGRNRQALIFDSPGFIRDTGKHVNREVLDLNGDAIVDYIDSRTDPPTVRLGNGSGFDEPGPWTWPDTRSNRYAPQWVRHTDKHNNIETNIFDIDGDGFADLVDGRSRDCGGPRDQWCVYRGGPGGFALEPEYWPAPMSGIQHADDGGQEVFRGIADLNGDGLPDWVDASTYRSGDRDPYPHWTVYWNDGKGFASSGEAFRAPVGLLTHLSRARTVSGLADMNGDGLSDLVVADTSRIDPQAYWQRQPAWLVYFNNGRGFAAEPFLWEVEGGEFPLPNFMSISVEGGRSVAGDLLDMTGDGLPDLLRKSVAGDPALTGVDYKCAYLKGCYNPASDASAVTPYWCCYNLLLYVNTGSGFSAPLPWQSQPLGLRRGDVECPGKRCWNIESVNFDIFDIDGDGFPDLVDRVRNFEGRWFWRVFFNPSSPRAAASAEADEPRVKPNLLLAMKNGVGGETHLDYTPAAWMEGNKLPLAHWLVSRRRVYDGLQESPVIDNRIAYSGGDFGGPQREFLGFAAVRESDARGLARLSEFHQDVARKGRLWRTTTFAKGACDAVPARAEACDPALILERSEFSWEAAASVQLSRSVKERFYLGAAVEDLTVTRNYKYDRYGNITLERVDAASAGISETRSSYIYRQRDSGGMPGLYKVDKPDHTILGEITEDGFVPAAEKSFDYDWDGAVPGVLRSVATCMSWSTVAGGPGASPGCKAWSTRRFEHDAFGNMVKAIAPGGSVSRTIFDGDALYAKQSIDAAGLTTFARHDPRNGKVLFTKAPNGVELHAVFDGLGRPLSAWGPGHSAASPLWRKRYVEAGGGAPGYIYVEADGQAPQTTFYDGIGRVIAVKRLSESEDGVVTTVSGLELYNESAQVVREALPFVAANPDLETLDSSMADAEAWVGYRYDEQGRRSAKILPSGAEITYDSSAPGIKVTVDANLTGGNYPGSASIDYRDALGRTIRSDRCSKAPLHTAPYRCPAGTLIGRSTYSYDMLGRVIERSAHSIEDADRVSTVRFSYDGLGNRIAVSDDSSGLWRYEYNADSRLASSLTPGGKASRYSYDAIGRLLRSRSGRTRSVYRYHKDGGGLGRIRNIITRGPSGKTSKSFEYDPRGRKTAESVKISPRGHPAMSYTFHYAYDASDRPLSVDYPTSHNGVREIVETRYSAFGSPTALYSGATAYVLDVVSDAYGRPRRMDYGNGLSDRYEYSFASNYEGDNGRLRCIRTAPSYSGGGACDDDAQDLRAVTYEAYDPSGRLLRILDRRKFQGGGAAVTPSLAYAYYAAGRLRSVSYADGTTESFSYDSLGNIRSFNGASYRYDEPSRPHWLSAIENAHTSQSIRVEHDEDGNISRKGAWTFSYDHSNLLGRVYEDGELSALYLYDESGRRVAYYDGSEGAFVYDFGLFSISGGILERRFFLGSELIASDQSPAPRRLDAPQRRTAGPGMAVDARRVQFLHRDHQGSPRLSSDGYGQATRYYEYTAYGARRGVFDASGLPAAVPSTDIAYTGHRESRASQLLFTGSRYYDPQLGSFTSLDPAFQYPSPYSYAGGDPVSGRDPDGRFFEVAAIDLLAGLIGAAAFVDNLVRSGNLGASLTAGVVAGLSMYSSNRLAGSLSKSLSPAPTWFRYGAAVSGVVSQGKSAMSAISNGNFASGIVTAGLTAASLMGVESVHDGPGAENIDTDYAANGIDIRRGQGKTDVIIVGGICATKGECVGNALRALKENAADVISGEIGCDGNCKLTGQAVASSFEDGKNVLLYCNSYGGTKCIGMLPALIEKYHPNTDDPSAPSLTVKISGAPIARPPRIEGVTYHVNLFDPVTWIGPAYLLPFRSDVVLGESWWVPLPLIVHQKSFYGYPSP